MSSVTKELLSPLPASRQDALLQLEDGDAAIHFAEETQPSVNSPPEDTSSLNFLEPSTSVPRFLYRVFSDGSSGVNTHGRFISFGMSLGSKFVSVQDMVQEELRDHLRNHLGWTYKPHDPFISWSGSMLWTLQYAVYKQHNDFKPMGLSICVLDTHKIDSSSIYPADWLL
jgi:hypothetical protein